MCTVNDTFYLQKILNWNLALEHPDIHLIEKGMVVILIFCWWLCPLDAFLWGTP